MANARMQAHIRPYGTVTENARRIVRARLAELYVWAQYVRDESRAREQHQLRIAAKRLRYTLELFRDFLPEQTSECIKALKGLQDALGLLHDCDVLIAILRSALFVSDEDTPLFTAIPEARDVPPALLEVLGQRAQLDGELSTPADHQPAKHKKKKQHKNVCGKKRLRAARKAKEHKRKGAAMLAEEARSRVRPSREQRAALEQFLMAKMRERADLYRECVKRWNKLEEREFRATVLHLIDAADMPGHLVSHPLADHHAPESAQL